MVGEETRKLVGVVLVVVLPGSKVIAGEAVALGRRVGVVQVRGDGVDAEPAIVAGQIVVVADEYRRAVVGHIRGPRAHSIKGPQSLHRQVGRHADVRHLLRDLVDRCRRKRQVAVASNGRLVRAGAAFISSAGGGVNRGIRRDGRRRARSARKAQWAASLEGSAGSSPRARGGTGASAAAAASGIAPAAAPCAGPCPRTQPFFRDQHAACSQQSQPHQIAAARKPGFDEFLPVLKGVVHLFPSSA